MNYTSICRIVCVTMGLIGMASMGWTEETAPADPQPRWWKGNPHAHTFWSDGITFPELAADWYRTNGYNFLAITDHNNAVPRGEKWIRVADARHHAHAYEQYQARFGKEWVETRGTNPDAPTEVRVKQLYEYRALVEEPGQFLVLGGEELTHGWGSRPIHIVALNLARHMPLLPYFTGFRETIEKHLDAVEEEATQTDRLLMAAFAHPNLGYPVTGELLAELSRIQFMEIYNGHPGTAAFGDTNHPSIWRLWDIANTLRIAKYRTRPIFGLAADDTHSYTPGSPYSPGRGWVVVRSRYLTPERLIRAMQRGDFYASTGVALKSLKYSPTNGVLELEIEPDGDATFSTEFIGTLTDYDARTEPRLDEEGKPILYTTDTYSADVGKVLATVTGLKAAYKLTGQELYVRAVVTSSRAPANPNNGPGFENQRQQLWTQPVGWERHMEP